MGPFSVSSQEPSTITRIAAVGLGIAKNGFALHGLDAEGKTVLKKELRRAQVVPFFAKLDGCRVGLDACHRGTGDGLPHPAPRVGAGHSALPKILAGVKYLGSGNGNIGTMKTLVLLQKRRAPDNTLRLFAPREVVDFASSGVLLHVKQFL